MQLVDWLNDLTVRFLINLPASELTSVSRICFQIEEAQWYYEDFVRPLEAAAGNHLPHLPLKEFCLLMFRTCPLTSSFTQAQHIAAYDTFLAYKTRIPVRGAIMLDQSMERAVLVKGWKKGASWSFPRGKINKDEKDLHCAVREVYEETGYDIKAAGLVPKDEDAAKYIDVNIREQQVRLFVFSGVPLDTHFEPRTRKEISGIMWYNLRDLPGFTKPKRHSTEDTAVHQSKFYMVAPFIGPLKKWIGQQRRTQAQVSNTQQGYETAGLETDEPQALSDVPGNDTRSQELRQLLNIGSTNVQPLPTASGEFLQHPVDGVRQLPQEQYQAHGQHMQQMLTGYGSQQQVPTQFPPQGLPFDPRYQHGLSSMHGMPPFLQQSISPVQHVSTPPNNLLSLFNGSAQSVPPPQQTNSVGLPFSQHGLQQQLAHQQGIPQSVIASQSIQRPYEEPNAMRAAPKASELPAPKLNAHAMRLLQTFKTTSSDQEKTKIESTLQPSTHQTRLLDLFKSPTPAQAKAVSPASQPVVSQLTPQAASPLPEPAVQRPMQNVQKSAAPAVQIPPVPIKTAVQPFKAKQPQQEKQIKPPTQPAEYGFMQEMQGFQNRKPAALPHPRQASQSPANTVRRHKHKNSQEAAKVPAFTILPRPGSAKEESADFKPQILKRSSQEGSASPSTTPSGIKTPQQDHLLALFGKGRTATSSVPQMQTVDRPATSTSALQPGRPVTILQHEASPVQPGKPVTILQHNASPVQPAPVTPQATLHVPDRALPTTTQQSSLLDLFKKPNLITSPETPISPFTLGSPHTKQQPPLRTVTSPTGLEKRPELLPERKASNSSTPTEAKGFLLGFLNNVVQKEGRST